MRWLVWVTCLWSAFAMTGCSKSPPHNDIAIHEGDPCAEAADRLRELTIQHQQLDLLNNLTASIDKVEALVAGYEQLFNACPERDDVGSAIALAIGNIKLSQQKVGDALVWYDKVVARYPHRPWEVMQALKSSADALYDAGEIDHARKYDLQLLATFQTNELPELMAEIVRSVKLRTKK